MKQLRSFHRAAVATALAAIAGLAPACTSVEKSYCQTVCDCNDCTELDFDKCIDSAVQDRRYAREEGCGEAYDNILTCITESTACAYNQPDPGQSCDAATTAYYDCLYGGF
ncbi:MAG: hypothetical protein R3B70_24640 [Polyangiaceae bacterium]